jgi:hypothetical protein
MRTHDEAIESMSDVGKWQNANCETCGGPVRWRWTNLRAVADTGDERVAGKEVEHTSTEAVATLTRRVEELEQEREQWEVNWNNAADFDLCRDLADGKPIAPALGSVPDKLMRRVEELEPKARAFDSVIEVCEALTTPRDDKRADTLVEAVLDKVNECKALRARVEELEGALRECYTDIFQTARANQSNLTGVDLAMPDDPPCLEAIGKRYVHQQGINESLRLLERVAAALAAKEVRDV